jgi:hypothetical protein
MELGEHGSPDLRQELSAIGREQSRPGKGDGGRTQQRLIAIKVAERHKRDADRIRYLKAMYLPEDSSD